MVQVSTVRLMHIRIDPFKTILDLGKMRDLLKNVMLEMLLE